MKLNNFWWIIPVCCIVFPMKTTADDLSQVTYVQKNGTTVWNFNCSCLEQCCDSGCCGPIYYPTPFWGLWHFWFIVGLVTLLCSLGGGGYWYNQRVISTVPIYAENEPMVSETGTHPRHDILVAEGTSIAKII